MNKLSTLTLMSIYLPFIGIYVAMKNIVELAMMDKPLHFFLSATAQAVYICITIILLVAK